MHIRLPARIGAYACLGIVLAMAGLALREPVQPGAPVPPAMEMAAPADPLQARLLQCQQAGEAAGSDPDCLAVWAENRRRFLGLGRALPAEPIPAATGQTPDAASAPGGPDAAFRKEH